MQKIIFLFLVSLCACKQETRNAEVVAPLYDSSYKPAVFQDADRLQKIKDLFPVVDSMYKIHAEKNHFPGIAFGIVVDGQLVYTGNHGYTDIAKKIPVTPASMFRIASMSKSFTAMAILKLRDEGKLGLDDPIYLYIPEFRTTKYPTSDAPHITVRHLLTHGAGFPEDNPWGDRQLADTDKELLEFLGKQISFSNPPGIAYEYSNLGFALLGKIVTKVSGQRYQDYIKEHIWKPLGMNNSEWEYANVDSAKLAHGYRWLNETWIEETLLHDTPDGSWGAMGSMITSIEEFGKYMALHIAAWPPSNAKDNGPVKRSSVREMHHPWRFNGMNPNYRYADGRTCATVSAYSYGLGWLRDCDGKIYISHSGGLPGFGSQWRFMPDYGIGVVAFGNRTYAGMGAINLQVLDTLIKRAGLQPRRLPVSTLLETKAKELLGVLPGWNNAEQSGIFAENFFPDYPMDTLKKYSNELYAKAGKIKGIKEIKPENQLRGTIVLEGEHTDIEIYITLSPENPPLIQEYHIRELPRQKIKPL